ncbi:MAG: hypothetical protein B9S26_01970 [Opitutia bacterium Tous-C4FEB]|nr:MAG: hypothetical protein B9S35_11030 [Opitutae bacterium Tous-C5TDCM]PAW90765.1 MAG: hypothetical protein B9S26_01970 [Opitutae bacterium Tous-C4FEB]
MFALLKMRYHGFGHGKAGRRRKVEKITFQSFGDTNSRFVPVCRTVQKIGKLIHDLSNDWLKIHRC